MWALVFISLTWNGEAYAQTMAYNLTMDECMEYREYTLRNMRTENQTLIPNVQSVCVKMNDED